MNTYNCSDCNSTNYPSFNTSTWNSSACSDPTLLRLYEHLRLMNNSVVLVLASLLLHTLLAGVWLICIGGRKSRKRRTVCMCTCGGDKVGGDPHDSVPDFDIDGDEAAAGATRTAFASRVPRTSRTQRAHHRTILKPESTRATVAATPAASGSWGMVLAPDVLVRTSSLSPEVETTSSSEALAGGTSSAGSEPEFQCTVTSENETENGAADGVATASPSIRRNFMHHDRNTCGPPTSGGPLPEFVPRASAAKNLVTVTRLFTGNGETEESELSELGAGWACGSVSGSAAQSPECARVEEMVVPTRQRSPKCLGMCLNLYSFEFEGT